MGSLEDLTMTICCAWRETSGVFVLAAAIFLCSCNRPSPARYGPNVPVIDVHTHTFNLSYLPLRGIVRAKAQSQSLPENVQKILESAEGAEAVAKLFLIATANSSFEDRHSDRLDHEKSNRRLGTVSRLGQRRDLTKTLPRLGFSNLEIALLLEISTGLSARTPERQVRVPTVKSLCDQLAVHNVLPISHGHHTSADERRESSTDHLQFINTLRMRETEIAKELRRAYPQVSVFVHHMMDLERAYDDRGRLPLRREPYFDFSTQSKRAAELDRTQNGRLVHFTAYDPFRRGDEALASVKEGIRNGALGVKFYPPSGYRPIDNFTPKREGNEAMKNQWDRRYAGWDGKQLDRQICRFLDYCMSNSIPIFTHSQIGEFESVKGYGLKMSSPQFWKNVLSIPDYSNLILCFGHAGGAEWWTDASWSPSTAEDSSSESFGRQVYELCVTYPRVYCEFSIFEGILDAQMRSNLRERLLELFSDQSHPYDFSKKVMYGTDWHMLSAVSDYPRFLEAATELFEGPLESYASSYFSANALNYLGVANSTDYGWSRLSEVSRRRFEEIHRQLGLQ